MISDKEILCKHIKESMADKGLSQKFVASKIGKTEKQLSDILTKNASIDVFDVRELSRILSTNFFDIPIVKKGLPMEDFNTVLPKRKRAKIIVSIEVDDDSNERRILETILDKPTVKKLLG